MEALSNLRTDLENVGDPIRAQEMKAYMKGHFPFIGVQAVPRNEIIRKWRPSIQHLDFWDLIHSLWEEEEREFQYVAIELLKKKKYTSFKSDDIHHIRELICTKSWWDSVDHLAAYTLGGFLQRFPEKTTQITADFSDSNNMWLVRSTLIFQLKYGNNTDFELMKELIYKHADSKEFFIQKAIGWALRQYSKSNPDAVRGFVQTIELKTVARREAYKYI